MTYLKAFTYDELVIIQKSLIEYGRKLLAMMSEDITTGNYERMEHILLNTISLTDEIRTLTRRKQDESKQ